MTVGTRRGLTLRRESADFELEGCTGLLAEFRVWGGAQSLKAFVCARVSSLGAGHAGVYFARGSALAVPCTLVQDMDSFSGHKRRHFVGCGQA